VQGEYVHEVVPGVYHYERLPPLEKDRRTEEQIQKEQKRVITDSERKHRKVQDSFEPKPTQEVNRRPQREVTEQLGELAEQLRKVGERLQQVGEGGQTKTRQKTETIDNEHRKQEKQQAQELEPKSVAGCVMIISFIVGIWLFGFWKTTLFFVLSLMLIGIFHSIGCANKEEKFEFSVTNLPYIIIGLLITAVLFLFYWLATIVIW